MKNWSHNKVNSRIFAFHSNRKYAKSGKHFVEGRTQSDFCRSSDKFETFQKTRPFRRFPERLKSFRVLCRQYLIQTCLQQRVILVKRDKKAASSSSTLGRKFKRATGEKASRLSTAGTMHRCDQRPKSLCCCRDVF